jgi:peptide/nickel transport system permease protein
MSNVLMFAVRRIIAAVFIVVAMITVTFVIFWSIPSTPASFIYPNSQHLSNYQIQRANHLLGLDRPKIVQWSDYLWHVSHGDFGKSWAGTRISAFQQLIQGNITDTLYPATRITASILLGGALLVLLLALPLGALAARYRNSIGDRLLSFLTLLAICTHPMVLGLILRTIFGDQLKWLPDSGYCTFVKHPVPPNSFGFNGSIPCGGGPWPWFEHLILPWISFALLFLALYTRISRASVLEVLHEDYVRTAQAKGANNARVLGRHVLPNAGLRVVTMIGMEIATALGVCVYIESAFAMPGLGRMAVNSFAGTFGLDLPVILAIVTMVAVIVVVGNLVVDLLYALLDPRVAHGTMRVRHTEGTDPLVV